MPAHQSYREDHMDPFAADSTSVYTYPFIPTISPTDYQLTEPKTFFPMMEFPYDKPNSYQMQRSKSTRSRARDGWAYSHPRSFSHSDPVSPLFAPIPSVNRTPVRRRPPPPPLPSISVPSVPSTSPPRPRPSTSARRPPSPPTTTKLRSVLSPTRPAPAPPLFTRSKSTPSLLIPPFMVPSSPSPSSSNAPIQRRPAPPRRATSYSPRRRSPDLYKQVLQTNFTMSPAGQKTREMGARMAMRLWNANLELERLVKVHEDAVNAFEREKEAERDDDENEEDDSSESSESGSDEEKWETDLEKQYGTSKSLSNGSKLYPSPRVFDTEQEISASVTEAILADMEGLSISSKSRANLSFLDDDWEPLDPFMQLPHPTSRSPTLTYF